jgi:hypothetical protein
MLIQVQYRIPVGVPFDRKRLDQWLNIWLFDESPPGWRLHEFSGGVRVRVTDWDGHSQDEIREWMRTHPEWALNRAPGIVARYARQNQTFCDYDTPKIQDGSISNIFRIARCLGIKPKWVEYRRTKRGWHLAIEWNRKFSPAETVALQAVLGSDPVREMFNLTRALSGKAVKNKRWNLLFERKVQ